MSSPLPALHEPHADARSGVALLSVRGFADSLAYWRAQLCDLPSDIELPTDRPRPTEPSRRIARVSFEIPAELRRALVSFKRQRGLAAYTTLLSAWQLLLHRYSGSDDIVVGTPTPRRYRGEVGEVATLFSQQLVLRARFGEGLTFAELVDQVHMSYVDAVAHDGVPFETLVTELAAARAGGAPPFSRYFFSHRHAGQATPARSGRPQRRLEHRQGTSEFDLTLSILETQDRLSGTLHYSTDLFEPSTAERIANNYVQLLTAALEAPTERVGCLEMVAEQERRLLTQGWNDTSSAYPELCVHQLFEAQASVQPDAVAVVADAETLTYRELDEQAERLADELRALGVDREQLVAVCVHRSATLLVTLLAVLKAGAAYVPLDPEYPPERVSLMLEDSHASVLVSEPSVVAKLGQVNAKVLLVGPRLPAAPAGARRHVASRAQLSHLAYVIYTSGSTGRPKGVEVTHRGLVNLLHAMRAEPGMTRADVLQSVTTVCFDIAALELFLPLVVGARVVISNRETSLSPVALEQSLVRHGATLLQATPVTWRMLLDNGWKGTPGLKVLCGGEAMGKDLAERLLETRSEIWNLYGPTETTIWSSVGRVRDAEDAMHVGRPIANTELFVTNAELALQPIGVPGELLIGGDGLARGYLNRAELSRERFVVNALGSRGRLYRTGDLAVRRPDGSIRLLGRADHQLKIRGFRVEPGEIEARLAEHADVRQAAVVAPEIAPGQKELVAYCVRATQTSPASSALREHLKTSLPHYMIPSKFVIVDELPLTPNGKIDRNRLLSAVPATDDSAPVVDAEMRHDLDRSLLAVWEAVLGRTGVGIDDDFFNLGGDSMRAIRLVKEMHRATGIEYPLSTLFGSPTIRQLVDGGGRSVERAASVVKLNAATAGTPIYCLAGVQLYRPFAQHFSESPVYGIYSKQELAGIDAELAGVTLHVPNDVLVETYADAVVRHATQRRLVLAGFSFGGLMALEVSASLQRRGFEVIQVVLFDAVPNSAYARSLTKAVADFTRRVLDVGPRATLRDLRERLYSKLSAHRSMKHGAATGPLRDPSAVQGKAFEDLSDACDPRGKRYDVDVLLIKASRQELGIGTVLKPDYGYRESVTGRLDIAEIDVDHYGMVNGDSVTRLFEIVSTRLRVSGHPSSAES
jgi:amino acid adenylation domain-containing protein